MANSVCDEVKPLFSFLLDDHGCSLSETYDSSSFGDSLAILACDDFRIRFIRDRGQIFVDIGPASKNDEWYDLNLVRATILRSPSDEVASIENLAIFLRDNYFAVKDLFEGKNVRETEKALEELQQLRAQKMFPQMLKPKT
jgi:hypothetical protein